MTVIEQCSYCIGRHRPPVQKSLDFVAAVPAQQVGLLIALNTLCIGGGAERVAQSDHRAHDRGGVRIGAKILYERPIDLDLVEAEFLQIAKAGIAGPEVVHRKAHADRAQFPKIASVSSVSLSKTPSVISNSSLLGSRPVSASAARTEPRKPDRRNCTGEMFTATVIDAGQPAASRQAA